MNHYVFADGRQVRHCTRDIWQLLTIDGEHLAYMLSEHIDYATVRR